MNTSEDFSSIREDRAAVNAAIEQSYMISTKSGRDYNQIQTYDPAGTPTTGDVPPSVVVRQVEYDYEDENGDLAYQVVREEFADGGKAFRQRQREGHSWRWSIAGLSPVPYHLPRVLQVLRSGGLIFIVEGEKCADVLNSHLKLNRLNAVATCNNGGAGHWGTVQSARLKGAKVALLPDNDEAGAQHVVKAARHLLPHVKSMKRLELPDLPLKGDIADWLAAGHSIAELQALYHAASEYTPPAEPEATKRERPVLRLVQGGDRPRLTAWANKALEGETNELAALDDGRFHAMKAAANRLGTIAAHGLLTEAECLSSLMWAMDSNGYARKKGKGQNGAEKEARWYFNSGKAHPCDLPSPRDLPALERPDATIPDDFVAYIPEKKVQEWKQGLPVAVRGLMNAHQGNGPLLDLLVEGKNRSLIFDDQNMTLECMFWLSEKLGRGMTLRVIREMVNKAADPHGVQFLRKSLHNITDHRDTLDHDQGSSFRQDFRRNPCGCGAGRSPETYALLSIETILNNLARFINAPLIKAAFPPDSPLVAPIRVEFMATLGSADLYADLDERYSDFIETQPGFREAMAGVRDEHRRIMYRLRNPQSAPIPDGVPFKNASAYKSVCAAAFLRSKGGRLQIPRQVLCAFIGCTDAALKGVLDRAGILIDKLKYSVRQVRSMADFNAIRLTYDKVRKGFPRLVQSGDKRIGLRTKDTAKFIEAALADGATVNVLYHQANLYIIKRLTQMGQRFMRMLLALLAIEYKPVVSSMDLTTPELMPEPVTAPVEKQDQDEEKTKKPKKDNQRSDAKLVSKPSWEAGWIGKLANTAAPLSALADPSGELVPPETPNEAIEALFDRRRVINQQTLPIAERKEVQPVINQPCPCILEKYNIAVNQGVSIQRIYNAWWVAKQAGEGEDFYAALDEITQIYLEAFANDDPVPETSFVMNTADWLMSIGATVTEVVYHETERIAA